MKIKPLTIQRKRADASLAWSSPRTDPPQSPSAESIREQEEGKRPRFLLLQVKVLLTPRCLERCCRSGWGGRLRDSPELPGGRNPMRVPFRQPCTHDREASMWTLTHRIMHSNSGQHSSLF